MYTFPCECQNIALILNFFFSWHKKQWPKQGVLIMYKEYERTVKKGRFRCEQGILKEDEAIF